MKCGGNLLEVTRTEECCLLRRFSEYGSTVVSTLYVGGTWCNCESGCLEVSVGLLSLRDK